MSRFSVGDVVGGRKICNAYDAQAVRVLASYLEVDHGSKGQRKYKICKELPGPEEYAELRKKHFTTTVGSLISDAYSELESLHSEMDEWYNNLPESLQQADRGVRVEEAANTLGEHTSEPDVSEAVAAIEVFSIPSFDVTSRADRCAEAAGTLRTAIEALNDYGEEHKELSSEIDSLVQELENTADSVEGVEFPGMYG